MAKVYFRGDAQGRAQVVHATPEDIDIGDIFALTINRKTVEYIAEDYTVEDVVNGLVAAIGQFNNDIPEWAEVSASVGYDTDGETVTHLVLTGLSDGTPFTVTDDTDDGGLDGPQITVVQEFTVSLNEIQRVRLANQPTGGTFTLTFSGQTTSNIAYNASAATVQSALEALSNIAPGDVIVTLNETSDWNIEFDATYGNMNVALITGDGTNLTGSGTPALTLSTETTPTGPYHWDEPKNWSGGALPTTGDEAYIANLTTDIRYGLATITDTLAELHFMASFTGRFGLTPQNEAGYFEYRQLAGVVEATLVFIGEGQGSGSPFINLDSSNVQTELVCTKTGQPDSVSLPAVLWKGTHSSNVVRIFKGSFGAALLIGEVATIATFQVGYLSDKESDVEYSLGEGVTLTTIQISGGDGEIALGTANATTFTITGGTCVLSGTFGVSTTFSAAGDSTVIWKTTGTLGGAPVLADEAVLDFSQDMRTKTVTNPIEVYSDEAEIIDPFQTVSNLRIDANYTGVALNGSTVGTNVRITRGTPS